MGVETNWRYVGKAVGLRALIFMLGTVLETG
jgi:hypothetical protein